MLHHCLSQIEGLVGQIRLTGLVVVRVEKPVAIEEAAHVGGGVSGEKLAEVHVEELGRQNGRLVSIAVRIFVR